jgi:acyl carrier protein
MRTYEDLEAEIKSLIIEAMMLEDVTPSDIDTDAPLFNEGLGLDSIDSLDLEMVLEERYGVRTNEDPDEAARRSAFASVRALAAFVAANRTR